MAERVANPLLNSFLLGAALVVTVGVVIWMASGEPDPPEQLDVVAATETPAAAEAALLTLGEFTFDRDRLAREWEEERAAYPLEIGADEEQLIEVFYATNEQTSQDADETQLLALHDRFVVDVQRYVVTHGPRAFRSLSWVLVESFQDALEDAVELAQPRGVAAWEVLGGTDAQARTLRQRLGNFYVVARRAGLVDERGAPAADEMLLTVLFRYRWLSFAEDYASPALMTAYERVVLWRWRIEAAEGLPLQQRLALLEEIESVYDGSLAPDAVRGVLYYREGDRERARSYLRRAAARFPEDDRYQRMLAAVEGSIPARP